VSAGHDAASVAAQTAGAGTGGSGVDKVPPAKLIERFCGEEARGLAADPGTREENGRRVSRGWCGFNGTRSDDPMVSGFDEGYDLLGGLAERGWRQLPAKGDWPLVIYMAWPGLGDIEAILEYVEGDLVIWEFENHDDAITFYRTLKDCP